MFPAELAGAVTSPRVGLLAGPCSSRCDELRSQGCLWHDLTQCTSKYTAQKELFHVSLVSVTFSHFCCDTAELLTRTRVQLGRM